MGYDIYLSTPEGTAQVPRHNEGSIQQYGLDGSEGTVDAEISVTFNYNDIYYKTTGKTLGQILNCGHAKHSIPDLTQVVKECGTARSDNYWDATPGNAGAIAALLLDWAKLHPDAIWEVHA